MIVGINGKTQEADICEELNKFFTEIGPGLAASILDSTLDLNLHWAEHLPEFMLSVATESEICKLLFRISDSKATGKDGIPVRYLKQASEVVIPLLTHIIHLSIYTIL